MAFPLHGNVAHERRWPNWTGESLLLAGTVGVVAQPQTSPAESERVSTNAAIAPVRQWSASVRWENDTFGGTDRGYTDGVALALAHTGPSWLDPVADWLPWGEGRRTVSYDLAQAMLTPSDTHRRIPDPNDRPYAGVLSAGLTLHIERSNSYNGLKFITGVVGPWSLAKETQREVHRLGGWNLPQGWDYQLHNEPIFNFAYEYRHMFLLAGRREAWSFEALPIADAWAGNMLTQAGGGGLLRAGYNVPDDFGPTLVRGLGYMPPPRRSPDGNADWGFSVCGGGFGNLVLRDITLDGNTFKDSPSVDKKLFVPMGAVGLAVGNRHLETSFTYVFGERNSTGKRTTQNSEP